MLTFSIINVPRKIQASDMVHFESSDPSSSLFLHWGPKRHPPCLETGQSINLLYAILTFSIQLMYPERFQLRPLLWWLSFFSQQWKHPTSSLFLKCLVNIFTLATTYKFVYRPCGVMVSTLDFESSDPSSSLGRTSFCIEAGRDYLHVWRLLHHSIFFTQCYFLHSINVPRKIQASDMVFWFLSFFSQQWKHPTSSLFLKCLVNIFTLATTYKFVYRPCGVMVSTLDFESSDPSSSLGRTCFCIEAQRDILHVWRLVHPSIFFTQSLLSPFN